MILKHGNVRKIATGQGDDYTTGCLLDYTFFFISNSDFGVNIRLA